MVGRFAERVLLLNGQNVSCNRQAVSVVCRYYTYTLRSLPIVRVQDGAEALAERDSADVWRLSSCLSISRLLRPW